MKKETYPRIVEFEDGTFGVQLSKRSFADLSLVEHQWEMSSTHFADCKSDADTATFIYKWLKSTSPIKTDNNAIKRIVKI